jgi:hypothetical protein
MHHWGVYACSICPGFELWNVSLDGLFLNLF